MMASKLVYLPMDCKTFNQLPAKEQVGGVIKSLQISMMLLLEKIVTLIIN